MSDTDERSGFLRAVREGDAARVRSLAGRTPSLVGATDPHAFGATPLIIAAGADDRAMVDLLLDLGADIDKRSDWWAGGFGALDGVSDAMAEHLLSRGATLTPHAAAALGRADALRRMLDADGTLVHARGGDGQTPLHYARDAAIADLLLSYGAGVDTLDIDHASTPAQWLCDARPEVAAHLVTRGAAPDPFMAARIGDLALLERLVAQEPDGVDVRVTRERFPAAPPAAGHIYLYTLGEGCTLMHAAAASGRAEAIRWLVARGVSVGARGGYDDATPLHTAAWRDEPDSIGALVEAGADLNAVSGSRHHNEPLGWAIVSGATGAVRALLDRGAAVRDHHREDARAGAKGAFRGLNRVRPIAAWEAVAAMIEGSTDGGAGRI